MLFSRNKIIELDNERLVTSQRVHFYDNFALINHIGFIYIVQNELSRKFPVIIQYNKNVFSKLLCEEDKSLSISIKIGFAFPTKSLGASSVNCPYKSAILWRHFFDWNERGARILYLLILGTKCNCLFNLMPFANSEWLAHPIRMQHSY